MSTIKRMRNEYYIWRVCMWVYKNLSYHLCDEGGCKGSDKMLVAVGDPTYLRKKVVDAKMARFIVLADDRDYLDQWLCKKDGNICIRLTDKGLELTNHMLFLPTGLIKLLLKENKILITLLLTALITAMSEFSIIGFIRDIADKI